MNRSLFHMLLLVPQMYIAGRADKLQLGGYSNSNDNSGNSVVSIQLVEDVHIINNHEPSITRKQTHNTRSLKDRVQTGIDKLDSVVQSIATRWNIDKYPVFLKSVLMTKNSWKNLKVKFQSKVMNAWESQTPVKFVISFTGSSVTAGHSHHVTLNLSFPALTGKMLSPVFESVGLQVESRNAGIGHNPCLPYDYCVRTFAGEDADMVLWEHSFNCRGDSYDLLYALEHFVRESLALPLQPVVALASSLTPNWLELSCTKKNSNASVETESIDLTSTSLIHSVMGTISRPSNTRPMTIDSNLLLETLNNFTELQSAFSHMSSIAKYYDRFGGMQLWSHHLYEQFKCLGPYIPAWAGEGVNVVDIHPSELGHRLRADHQVYYWLLVLHEALTELMSYDTDEIAQAAVNKSLSEFPKFNRTKTPALTSGPIGEDFKCYTNYEPRFTANTSISGLILYDTNVAPNSTSKTFVLEDYNRYNKNDRVVEAHIAKRYSDFKYVLHGNIECQPLHLKMQLTRLGRIVICFISPVEKGSFYSLDDLSKAFVTFDIPNYAEFSFNRTLAREIPIIYTKRAHANLCCEVDQDLPKGNHVLTIVPTSQLHALLSYVLIP